MTLSRCDYVPSLVLLAQKFTNSKDSVIESSSPLARAACAANYLVPQQILSPCGGHRPKKLQSYPSTGLACSLRKIKRCKFFARAQHVQCAPQTNFLYGVLMPLYSCANVASLVSLAQKFTNSEDPLLKSFTPLARANCAVHHWLPHRISSPYGGHRPTKFRSNPSTGLACSLIKRFLQGFTRRHVARDMWHQSFCD